jgi:hypothetical protein
MCKLSSVAHPAAPACQALRSSGGAQRSTDVAIIVASARYRDAYFTISARHKEHQGREACCQGGTQLLLQVHAWKAPRYQHAQDDVGLQSLEVVRGAHSRCCASSCLEGTCSSGMPGFAVVWRRTAQYRVTIVVAMSTRDAYLRCQHAQRAL